MKALMKSMGTQRGKPTFFFVIRFKYHKREELLFYSFHQIRDRVIAGTRRRIQNFPLASEA